ncbi:hypothetical protein HanRHA438_Chr03g0136561 [Helianthus annuus]|nr:hypothetical protein HanRHA438_Chr03g0136561 [Helianthus annuus]
MFATSGRKQRYYVMVRGSMVLISLQIVRDKQCDAHVKKIEDAIVTVVRELSGVCGGGGEVGGWVCVWGGGGGFSRER